MPPRPIASRRRGPELFPTRDLTGLVQFGIELSSDRRDKLVEANGRSDIAILEDGAAPAWGLSTVLFLIGLALLLGLLVMFVRGRAADETVSEATPPPE